MQITGQILKVVPNMKDGYPETFTTPNGQFFVFNMAIQQPGGPLCGTINSKSSQYPLAAGTEITIEQSLGNQNEVKFKKINPQYQQGQQQPQQGYQQQNQPQQQAPPPQRDFEKENTGKCRFGLYRAILNSGVKACDLANDRAELEAVEVLSKYSMHGLPQQGHQQEQQAPPQQHDSNAGFIADDDIPF